MQAANAGDTVIVGDGTYGREGAMTGGDENHDKHSVDDKVVTRSGGVHPLVDDGRLAMYSIRLPRIVM
jgi:hypothetical protein